MSRGYLGGLNYEIPLNEQQQAPTPRGQQPMRGDSDMPPMEDDPLAVRGQKTDDYYENYSMLKNFVTDMQSKGVNPFEPDYSQSGGGLAFKTFQKLQAGLLYSANLLKQEYETEKMVTKSKLDNTGGYAPGFDPSQGDMLTGNPDAMVSYNPTYQVKEANSRLSDMTHDAGTAGRYNEAYMGGTEDNIDAQIASGQLSGDQGQLNKDMLMPNVHQTPQMSASGGGRSGGSGAGEIDLTLPEAIMNQATGAWKEGTYEETIIKGKRMLRSTKFADVIGKEQREVKDGITKDVTIQIKDWLKDPQTGQVTVRFTDPEMPDKNLSPQEAEQMLVSIMGNNPRYGGSTSIPKMYEAADKKGWLDAGKFMKPEAIIKDPSLLTNDTGRREGDAVLERESNKVRVKLDKTEDEIAKFSVQGKPSLHFDKDEKGYYLYNAKKLTNPKTGKVYKESETPRFTTQDEVVEFMSDNGYFDIIKEASYFKDKKPAGQSTVKKSAESQRAADLIAKHRKTK